MRAIFALIVVALVLAAAPAHANVTYAWHDTSVSCTYPTSSYCEQLSPYMPSFNNRSFTVTDSIVEAGSMSFTALCEPFGCPQPWPNYLIGSPCCSRGPDTDPNGGTFDVVFNPDGTLSGDVHDWDSLDGFDETGSGMNWNGIISFEDGDAFNVAGYWFAPPQDLPHPCCGHGQGQGHDPDPADPVPEPSSAAIILAAIGMMVGLGLRREVSA